MALTLSLAMVLSSVPTQALAETADQLEPSTSADLVEEASGKWGTCDWYIDIEGLLTVYSGEGVDTDGKCPWGEFSDSITKVVFLSGETDKVVLPADSSYLFADMDRLYSVDLTDVEASKVTNMESMFYGCSSLKSLDLSGLDTSKVENMKFMFADCHSLDSLDLSGWNTSSVTSMYWMFADCSSLESLDLSGLDTSKVTDMEGMFADCHSLASLDLSGWNTSSVPSMRCMFADCSSLESVDLSTFDTSNVTDMYEMFYGCSSLESVDLSTFDTSKVTNMSEMFRGCSELSTITVGKGWSTAGLENGFLMFEDCESLVGGKGTAYSGGHRSSDYARVDTPDAPGYLTLKIDASGEWGTCPWEIDAMGVLTVHPGEGEDTHASSPWSVYHSSITKVVFAADEEGNKVILPSDSSDLFLRMEGVTSFDFSGADSSKVTNMDGVFFDCSSLESLDLSGLDTSEVTNMNQLFASCSSLESLDLSGLDTSKVENMNSMFEDCTKLASINLFNFETSNAMAMNYMFRDCSALTSLDLSSFDTSELVAMSWMFADCSSLESLDLSSFETSKVTDMSCAFRSCHKLKTITVGKGWSTASVKEDFFTFDGCESLVGGSGTTYSADHAGTDYAHVDAPDAPGYLTLKARELAFERANLTVGQQVGLTFWLYLPEADGLDYSGSYVELTVDDKSDRTERVDLTDETPKDDKGRRGFAIDLTSIEMAEPVTAVFHYADGGEEKEVDLTYSVRDYFIDFDETAKKNPNAFPKETVDLVHATADLGHFMQPYLSAANDWAFGDDYEEMDKHYRELDEDEVAAAKAGVSDHRISGSVKGSGIKGVGAQLSFGSLTEIDVYLTPDDPDAQVEAGASYGGMTFPAEKQSDGRWLVRIEGLKPYDFGKAIAVTGNGGTGEFTVNVSVLGVANVDLSGTAGKVRDRAYAAAYYLWEATQEA